MTWHPPVPIRIAVVVAWGLFVFGGPFYRQVLDHDHPRVFKTWKMYSGYALGECTATYHVVENGQQRWISRHEAMYDEPRWYKLRWPQRILREQVAAREPSRICRKLGNPDLRAHIRCSTMTGWKTVVAPDHNACAP